ncbi:MAG: transposon-transfer assisting family protein [Roseburia sp. 1XD42-69]
MGQYLAALLRGNLFCTFESRSRTKVISDIKDAIKYLDDEEMIGLSNKVVAKPDAMSDKDFIKLKYIVAE